MIEWQPIETAPPDTLIIVWSPHINRVQTGILRTKRIGASALGWKVYCNSIPIVLTDGVAPTHWMPLPKPPK